MAQGSSVQDTGGAWEFQIHWGTLPSQKVSPHLQELETRPHQKYLALASWSTVKEAIRAG